MSFGENLTALRKSRGISRKDLAEMLGIPYTTLRNYETGQREPGHNLLIQIAKKFSVSIDSLIGLDLNSSKEKTSSYSDEAERIAIDYDALDSWGKRVVRATLDIELERCSAQRNVVSFPTAEIIELPVPIQAASAGTGEFADDDTAERIPVLRNVWTSRADYAIRVHGDSMEPAIHDGDLLLIGSQPSVYQGETGVFLQRGERYVKIYRGDHLESINPDYEDLPLDESCRCVGKVIGVLRPEWIAR
ncbi:MAG: XRE family transcriptional regulator [Candidatus Saccharibacteria bacterium]|nr:XRE family transcriptional regulator [Candidatus Saccharibacteria bacterium]